ncbi:hypothetical protein Mapa_006873 [Marchantia paleacea]|nr:hypothetical protein Mapa_006873 [Marchantia paleacea]
MVAVSTAATMCLAVALVLAVGAETAMEFTCPPALFSFGTSLSDTGNRAYVDLPQKDFSQVPPYGVPYFGVPRNRFSDGRLILDFFASAFGFPFIEPFLTDDAPDYTRGVNFAFSGALALPYGIPYYFDVQVSQFATFKARTLSLHTSTSNYPGLERFDEGLYIVFFGRNDLTDAYGQLNLTTSEVQETVVPKLVRVIVDHVQELYDNGARTFMVFNVNPQGCQPQYLTLYGDRDVGRDSNGCLATYNGVVRIFNSLLWDAVQTLRKTLPDSIIFFADLYGVTKQVFDNPKKYGFAPDKTLVACCGIGGKYNYDPPRRCGTRGKVNGQWVDVSEACARPSEYVSWDGVHFTEAFHRHVATQLLTGNFLDPPVDFSKTCNLDFAPFSQRHQCHYPQ